MTVQPFGDDFTTSVQKGRSSRRRRPRLAHSGGLLFRTALPRKAWSRALERSLLFAGSLACAAMLGWAAVLLAEVLDNILVSLVVVLTLSLPLVVFLLNVATVKRTR